MGIDVPLFDRLCDVSRRFRPEGRKLMLGRQRFALQGRFRRYYDRSLRQNGYSCTADTLVQEDGYAEKLMDALGFGPMETMDFSDYEGASLLHDLNIPVAEELEGQFGFIFDGGTLEHVFNVPVALVNVFRMLKPGGIFVSANGLNGWPGHGLYQFNPELAWTFWERSCACKLHACMGIPKAPSRDAKVWNFRDPARRGVRLRLRGKNFPASRVYLYYEAERLAHSAYSGVALQSDYERRWQGSETSGPTHFDEVRGN